MITISNDYKLTDVTIENVSLDELVGYTYEKFNEEINWEIEDEFKSWFQQDPSTLKKRIKYCKNPMEKKKLQQELNDLYRAQKKSR